MHRQQWLNWRRRGVGSSDAPIIMQVASWGTPYSLWQEKLTGEEREPNYAMQRGIELEEPARVCFEKKLNVEVFPKSIEHPTINFMRASVDGIDFDRKVLVEIKCPLKKESHELAIQGKVPEVYYPQLQHQLEVTGLDGMYYFSFDGNDGVIVEVARDQKYIDSMIEEERKFWQCVVQCLPPELIERDHRNFNGDKGWESLLTYWKSIDEKKASTKESLKAIEKQEEEAKQALIDYANGHSAIGNGVKLTKYLQRGQVDYSKIPQLEGIDLEMFRKDPSIRWRVTA